MSKTSDQLNMRNIWLISLVAACGGLLFGYDWVVIGGAKPFMKPTLILLVRRCRVGQ
ncbi:hypothetical protein [Photobacterium sanguinicancri]|uniref:hypothetical protein n=1 Tax=Photobacterium sanguinicancri TaxID=875932 RepID=UPI000AE05492|nr:hypothetical protein [Photobacterium sanguinicancri]